MCGKGRSTAQQATLLKVALGKVYKAYNGDRGSNRLQLFNVASIAIPPRYRAGRYNYQHDIAVLKLAKHVSITSAVNVACVDWNQTLDGEHDSTWVNVNSNGVNGTVSHVKVG